MVPGPILAVIRQKAAAEWPGDYVMQKHTIEEQSRCYLELQHFRNGMDASNEVSAICFDKAEADWPDDFQMQLHTFNSQIESAIDFFNATFDGVPQSVIDEVRTLAFTEWTGDYEMMLHTLREQIAAWVALNRA
jgi:hypothetical protein